jgi:hypothetical protein
MILSALVLGLQVATVVMAPVSTPGPAPTPAQALHAPSPVVERIVTVAGRTARLSLFDNREAVVSIHGPDRSAKLRRRRLSEHEYVGYLGAVTSNLDAVEEAAGEAQLFSEGGKGRITIYRPGHPPLVIHYSPLQTPSLAIGRLVAVLDDLEKVVLATNPSFDALNRWSPRVGDRVEMVNGQTATVTEVHPRGVIVVTYDDVAMSEVIPKAQRAARILRILEKKR